MKEGSKYTTPIFRNSRGTTKYREFRNRKKIEMDNQLNNLDVSKVIRPFDFHVTVPQTQVLEKTAL